MNKRKAARETEMLPQPDLFGEPEFSGVAKGHTRRAKPKTSSARVPIAPANPTSGLLNVRQAAIRLGLSKSTLDKMRPAGKGPKFIKSTERAVRYDPADLDAWIKERRRASNAGTE